MRAVADVSALRIAVASAVAEGERFWSAIGHIGLETRRPRGRAVMNTASLVLLVPLALAAWVAWQRGARRPAALLAGFALLPGYAFLISLAWPVAVVLLGLAAVLTWQRLARTSSIVHALVGRGAAARPGSPRAWTSPAGPGRWRCWRWPPRSGPRWPS